MGIICITGVFINIRSIKLSFLESKKIVRFSTVSINFFCFMRDGKKSKFDVLIKDLALSCVYGTTKYDRTNENKTNIKDKNIIFFKNSNLLIPLIQ